MGSWKTQVGTPPGPTFTAYETFTQGGGSVEINNGAGGSTTAIGSWKRAGNGLYLSTLYKQQFDEAGQLAATIKVRRLIRVTEHGNELIGLDNVDVFDPAGNLLFSPPPGSFHAVRMEAEPLNP